jgi:zinc protease
VILSLAPNVKPETAEQAALAEVERVRREGVTVDEVSAAARRHHAANIFRRDGSAAIAAALNQWIAVGDWTLFVTLDEKIAQVTPADVQRVAQKYLEPDKSTTGWFVPVATPTPARRASANP